MLVNRKKISHKETGVYCLNRSILSKNRPEHSEEATDWKRNTNNTPLPPKIQ